MSSRPSGWFVLLVMIVLVSGSGCLVPSLSGNGNPTNGPTHASPSATAEPSDDDGSEPVGPPEPLTPTVRPTDTAEPSSTSEPTEPGSDTGQAPVGPPLVVPVIGPDEPLMPYVQEWQELLRSGQYDRLILETTQAMDDDELEGLAYAALLYRGTAMIETDKVDEGLADLASAQSLVEDLTISQTQKQQIQQDFDQIFDEFERQPDLRISPTMEALEYGLEEFQLDEGLPPEIEGGVGP